MRLLSATGAAVCTMLASGVHAEDAPIEAMPAELALVDDALPGATAVALPIEDILTALTKRWGFSFVFDSRVVHDKRIRLPDEDKLPDVALAEQLREANLSLHRIREDTFAIRPMSASPQAAAFEVASLSSPVAASLIDTIVVTASAASSLSDIGSRGLLSLDEEALELIDAVNPAEAIYELPQSVASVTPANTSLRGTIGGLSLADLRGLGVARTLVLVNGRRRTVTAGGGFTATGVDINAIAGPFLERIEIFNRPNGAQIGPEAVAGAINFVTKHNLTQAEAGARYGLSERSDVAEYSVHLMGGRDFESDVNISAGVHFTKQGGIRGDSRSVISTLSGFALNGQQAPLGVGELQPGFAGSPFTPNGFVSGAVLADGSIAAFSSGVASYALDGQGGATPFVGSLDQLYSFIPEMDLIPPAERAIGFVSIESTLPSGVELFLDGHVAFTSHDIQLAPVPGSTTFGVGSPLNGAVAIDLTSPTVPPDVSSIFMSEFAQSPAQLILERRYVEVGPWQRTIDRLASDVAAGATAALGNNFDGTLTYRFGRSGVHSTEFNYVDLSRLNTALDPVQCNAEPSCIPVNLFAPSTISTAAADYIRAAPVKRRFLIEEHEIDVQAARNFNAVLPEQASLKFGASWRKTILRQSARDSSAQDIIGDLLENDARGDLTTIEAYATFDAPLARSSSLLGAIDVSAAFRITRTSNSKLAENIEAALNWSPVDGAALFARGHIGERPPNIMEASGAGQTAGGFAIDPCGGLNSMSNPIVLANCLGGGRLAVSAGFQQAFQVVQYTRYGNPNLAPEDIQSYVAGISVSPEHFIAAIPGKSSISVSWLSYRAGNAISFSPSPIAECYNSVGLSDMACSNNPLTGAPLIRRDPVTEQIVAVDLLMANRGVQKWQGVDIEAKYAVHPAGLGAIDRIWFSGLHTLTLEASIRGLGQATPTRIEGLLANPRNRSRLSLGVEAGAAKLNFFANRRGRAATDRSGIPETLVAPFTTIDATAQIQVGDIGVLTLGVENLTDREAPLVAAGPFGRAFPEYYDLIGRRFSLSLRASF